MTIREIAAKTNMSTDTLRYYERIGLLPPVPRNAAGIRNYDEYFVNFINFIKYHLWINSFFCTNFFNSSVSFATKINSKLSKYYG